MSDSHIYYNCPSCLAEFDSSSEKSGTSVKCPLCDHIFLIPSKSTFTPHWSVSSQHQEQEQSRLTAEKVAELFGQELSNVSFPNQRLSRSKLIDCPDCGTSISRLAAACPKCGRAGQAALEQSKYTKGIYLVICMVVSWLFVQFISSIREEGRKDRSIKANLELQRTINDPRATEGDYRRAYEKVLNP